MLLTTQLINPAESHAEVGACDAPSRPSPHRHLLSACPLCAGPRLHYALSAGAHRVVRCADCRLMLLNPQPADAELAAIARPTDAGEGRSSIAPRPSACGRWEAHGVPHSIDLARDAAARYRLDELARYRGVQGGTLLEVTAGHDEGMRLANEAQASSFQVSRVRLAPAAGTSQGRLVDGAIARETLEAAGRPERLFDVIALTGALERVRDPLALLRHARALLKADGVLLITATAVPAATGGWLRSRAARKRPAPFRADRLTYFDAATIQTALHQTGFAGAIVSPPDEEGAMTVISRAEKVGGRRTLSVVVPAFNEATTIGPMLDALLAKEVAEVAIEVIVVESNSTDGTREIVRRYADHPRVELVLEDQPRGKGHAVRTGLAHATGDFILIQDADLEYDMEDYEVLLEPLVSGREALVLGARHGSDTWWKMRQFTNERGMSLFFNLGHWFFTTLLNALFGQNLKDPFTMFKVFRRDCLFGLGLRCNRFDFDHELLVRLIQKGYRPVEIPVNYRSRSFKEGKKVSTFRDPLTWLWTLGRLRIDSRLDLLGAVERARTAETSTLDAAEALDDVPPLPRRPNLRPAAKAA